MSQEQWPHVVIIGAGFGGLYCAKALGGEKVRVTVVDRTNHHLFQPLLYQVATAALAPGDIAEPVRGILGRYKNVQVLLGEVTEIRPAEKRVVLADGELTYDYLVVATGARHAYFGHDEWEPFAPGLKSLEDALEIRKRVLLAFEAAERETDERIRQALLTFVIVGAGPTGVELAGAISEIARVTIAQDFRSIDPRRARVLLVEAGPTVLAAFPEKLQQAAEKSLARIGVEVRKGTPVTEVTPDHVKIGDELIPTRCTLWAAGVKASPLGKMLGAKLDRSGRVYVGRDLMVSGLQNVFVIGDLAHAEDDQKRVLPALGAVAQQQGKWTGKNILRLSEDRITLPFEYWDRGNMATIGRAAAVADIGPVKLHGLLAWLAWLVVHVMLLVGFEHKVEVVLKWIFAYLSHGRSNRLITGEVTSILPKLRSGEFPAGHAGEVTSQNARFAAAKSGPAEKAPVPGAEPVRPA